MFRYSVRRLCKGWIRQFATKRERTPLTLNECLDSPPARRGLWRNWFFLLIIAPVVYYFFFFGATMNNQGYSYSVKKQGFSPPPAARVIDVLTPPYGNSAENVDRPSGQLLQEKLRTNVEGKPVENVGELPRTERLDSVDKKMAEQFPDHPVFPSNSYYQIQKPKDIYKYSDMHEITSLKKKLYEIKNGSLIGTIDANNSFLARVPTPARHTKKEYHEYVPPSMTTSNLYCVPLRIEKGNDKALTKPRNVTQQMLYQKQLSRGGYFKPTKCKPRHRIAILVPYRNRPSNLAAFLFNIHPFLIDQGLEYRMFVVEQSGSDPFNKGRLFNAGYIEAQKYGSWDCLIFHDVDLLPTNTKILYTCPTFPRHMSSNILGWNKNDASKNIFGGVTAMTMKQYKTLNGYSNMYWGWGGEDTDMFWRIKAAGLPLMRYSKSIAEYIALPHEKTEENPIRHRLTSTAKERYKTDGLSNVEYNVILVSMYHTYTHLLLDINPHKENITELYIKYSR